MFIKTPRTPPLKNVPEWLTVLSPFSNSGSCDSQRQAVGRILPPIAELQTHAGMKQNINFINGGIIDVGDEGQSSVF